MTVLEHRAIWEYQKQFWGIQQYICKIPDSITVTKRMSLMMSTQRTYFTEHGPNMAAGHSLRRLAINLQLFSFLHQLTYVFTSMSLKLNFGCGKQCLILDVNTCGLQGYSVRGFHVLESHITVVALLGGYSNYFLTGCVARGLKPYPYLRSFLHQKRADLTVFPKFSQIGTHF